MAVDLGDPYPLSITIHDSFGNLANASNVELIITLPDGSSINIASVTPTSVGQYDYDFETTQVGRHNIRWIATGTNASAFSNTFYVKPIDDGEFISLPHFKAHIKKIGTTDDEIIRTFIGAACQVITDRMGQISPVTVTQDTYPKSGHISLRKIPVISIVSVSTLPGLAPVDEADLVAGPSGWSLNRETGIIRVGDRYTSRQMYRTIYRAGMDSIPQNYILAALELAAHMWRSSQQNTGGGRPSVGLDEMVAPGVTYALPYNVRQLLGLDKRPQKRVFVG